MKFNLYACLDYYLYRISHGMLGNKIGLDHEQWVDLVLNLLISYLTRLIIPTKPRRKVGT